MWRMKEPSRSWIASRRGAVSRKNHRIMEPAPFHAEAPQDSAACPAPYLFRYQPRRGLSIPAITVLDATGRVIEEEQRSVFRYLAQQGRGADILFGVGTTGE